MWWLLIVLHGVVMQPVVYPSEHVCWSAVLAFVQQEGMPQYFDRDALLLKCVIAPKIKVSDTI
jgi:hypothetical protein